MYGKVSGRGVIEALIVWCSGGGGGGGGAVVHRVRQCRQVCSARGV